MPSTPQSTLAIDGGLPAVPEGPPAWPRPSEAVRAALEAAYADGSWGRYHGPHCERLITELAKLCGVSSGWLCSSGTIAIELALRGLKVGSGDEAILAAYDFPGNFRAIEAVGGRPVLVDLAAGAWTLDIEQVAAAISPQTKAIIASHLHGSLADMRRLRQIADERGLAIVEDACQMPGATVGGKPAGSWGDCGVLSFGGSKLLTAGRGGAIVTNREDVIQRIKVFVERGNNAFPLSELQAAVLVPQLGQLATDNRQRRQAVDRLVASCAELTNLTCLRLPANSEDVPAFYKVPWLIGGNNDDCDSPDFEQTRRWFIDALKAEGVAVEAGFRGFARRTNQRCRTVGHLTNARRAAAGTVVLHHPVLLEPLETVVRVAAGIQKVATALSLRSSASAE